MLKDIAQAVVYLAGVVAPDTGCIQQYMSPYYIYPILKCIQGLCYICCIMNALVMFVCVLLILFAKNILPLTL